MRKIHLATGLGMLLLSACGSNNNGYDATGTFEATEVTVSAEASGKLLRFDVEEGSVLQAGTQVGVIDTVQLSLMKRQQEASMRSVKSQLPESDKQVAAIKQQIATAEREKHRIENLLKAGAANEKQRDDIDAQIALYNKQLNAQLSSLGISARSLTEQSSALDIQVALLLDLLTKCYITAPITGTVLAKYMEAGELASTGKPLFKMADTENLFLRAYITSGQLSGVKAGDRVTVIADYGADKRTEYPGVITWISDRSEFTPKTILTKDERANLVYAMKIAVKNDGYLKTGMYGGVKLHR
ncbi:MAG: HlyD family efflux transporter periplasmic adaptor subunit [Mediterranea sp.]|jgi:HlyD family secretion protein|nr:HlyD family efflux transporter periplasmic adaptor subunit [Mediterranea sp.]